MTVKINRLEIENVKRVKAVVLEPSENGLTIIGGDNEQGKTSVLDAIAWALGGDRYKPSEPRRDGSVLPPALHIELSNGLVVERKGANSALKVIDPSGNKAGQQLLNEFISAFALDLPKFMDATPKEKGQILLQIIGVGDQLYALEQQETTLYNQRHAIGQIADQKKKYAEELEVYPDAPDELVSAADLIKQQQEILAHNGENQRKRDEKIRYDRELAEAQTAFLEAQKRLRAAEENAMTASRTAEDLRDESTAELEKSIADIDEINRRVRINLDKARADQEAADYKQQYDDLTEKINNTRADKTALLEGAKLPLPGLSIADGELTYEGYKWDGMSGSSKLKVATAIVRELNPNCGFVLMDKLEQMDLKALQQFGDWLEDEGLQAIATRVSTGEECSVIIEDGYAVNVMQYQATQNQLTEAAQEAPKWKEGTF